MARTSVALFRMGNAASPRMDKVRDRDIEIVTIESAQWVLAGTGGISTSEVAGGRSSHWWRLDAGYDHGEMLLVWNDHGRHWLWEPARDMSLEDFTRELRASHSSFLRVD